MEKKYEAQQNEDGTWRVVSPEGRIIKTGATEKEANLMAYAYNVIFGYVSPFDKGEEAQS